MPSTRCKQQEREIATALGGVRLPQQWQRSAGCHRRKSGRPSQDPADVARLVTGRDGSGRARR